MGVLTSASGTYGYHTYSSSYVTAATFGSSYIQGKTSNSSSKLSGFYLYEDLTDVTSITVTGSYTGTGSNWINKTWKLDVSAISGYKYVVFAGWSNYNMKQYHVGLQIQNSAIYNVAASTNVTSTWTGNNENSGSSYFRVTNITFTY